MKGKKVVCINAKKLPKMLPSFITQKLKEGQIYTVERVLFFDMQHTMGYALKEIPFPKDCVFQGFLADRFRPVDGVGDMEKGEIEHFVLN